jgi:hypothetical protein
MSPEWFVKEVLERKQDNQRLINDLQHPIEKNGKRNQKKTSEKW